MDEIAKLELEFNTDNAQTGADKATQMLDNVGAHAESMGSAMSKAIEAVKHGLQFLGLGFGLLKATEAIQEAIQLAARYQALGIVMNQLGTISGYTSRQLDSFTQSLQKNGLSMNDSRQAIVNMMQANIDLANSSKLASVAQDAAAVANTSASDAYQRMIFGIESGSGRILKQMGLIVDFSGAYQRFGAQIGKNANELDEDEQIQARVNEVMRAGITITGAHSSAMYTADEIMRELSDSAKDLQTKFGNLFQPAYTAIILAFAHTIELASNNVGLLAGGMLAFGIKALAPTVSNILAFTKAQLEMDKAVLQGNAVMLGSVEATRASALYEAQHAEALMIDAKATYESALATAELTKEKEANAAATAALATADAAYTASVEVASAATKELNASMKASPLIVLMIAVTALGYAWDKLSNKMANASDTTRKFTGDVKTLNPALQQALDIEQKATAAPGGTDAHGNHIQSNDDLPWWRRSMHGQSELSKQRQQREELVLGNSGGVNPFSDESKDRTRIAQLNAQYDKGKLSLEAYATALANIGSRDAAVKELADNITNSLAKEDDITNKLTASKNGITNATNDQAASQERLNVAMDRATRDAQHQASVSADRLRILTTEGPRALQQYEATTGKTAEDIRNKIQESIDNSGGVLVGLTPEQLTGADSSKIAALAADRYKAKNPEDLKKGSLVMTKRESFVQSATTAVAQANQFGVEAQKVNASDYATQLTQTQLQLDKANESTRGAAQDQLRLAGAYREGVFATRAMEVRVAGLAAARGLDITATDAQRNAAARAAEALTRTSQAAQIAKTTTDELTKSHYAAADAARLGAAALEGPEVLARTQREVEAEAIQRPGGALEAPGPGSSATERAQHERDMRAHQEDLDKTNLGVAQQTASQINLQADAQERLATASKQGKQAVFEATIANEAYAAVSALQITDDAKRKEATDLLTDAIRKKNEATQEATNNAALEATQHSTDMTRAETQATLEGVAALERFQVARAGAEAAHNYVGSPNGRQAAIDAAEVQEQEQLRLTQAQRMAQSFRNPILQAINDVDRGFDNLFQRILNGGMRTFHDLAHAAESSLRNMLADFVSSEITNAIKNKLTDIWRQSQGLVTASSNGGIASSVGSNPPSTGMPVDIKSFGGIALSAVVAAGAATGAGVAGGPAGSSGAIASGIGGLAHFAQGLLGKFGGGASAGDMGEGVANANLDFGGGSSMMATAGAGLGMAAGGFTVGTEIGKMTTNHAVGALAGAAGGAATGAAMGMLGGPIGVLTGSIIGGLAGAVAGFMSVGSMSHDAARQLQEGRDSMLNSLASYKEISTMTQSIVEDQLRQNTETQQSLIAQANNTLPGKRYEAERNAQIDAINQAAAEGAATIKSNFFISIQQQIDAINGDNLTATLYNLKLAFDNNTRSMAAAGATAEQAAMAQTLYNDSVEKATRDHALDIAQTKGNLEVQILQTQGATYAADRLKMMLDQQQQMNDAIEKWGQTNPEIIAQLKVVQQLQLANGAQAISDTVANEAEGFRVRQYSYEFANTTNDLVNSIMKTLQLSGTITPTSTSTTPTPTDTTPISIATVNINGVNKDGDQLLTEIIDAAHARANAIGGMGATIVSTIDKF